VRTLGALAGIRCPADYKSAIQQIENLRYFVIGPVPGRSGTHIVLAAAALMNDRDGNEN
jgi:hypothetical protein